MRLVLQAVVFTTAMASPVMSLAVGQDVPAWVTDVAASDQRVYRAAATAETRQQAREFALADIAGQVAVTLSSSSTSVTRKHSSGQQPAETSSTFRLNIAGQNIPIQFNDVSVEESYRHANGDVSVLVSVPKTRVVEYLRNRLATHKTLQFPGQQSRQQQLLWILRYKQPLQLANAYTLALSQLTGSAADNAFEQQLAELLRAEQELGVRIVAGRELDALSAAIAKNMPVHSNPELWLQLEQSQQQRQVGAVFQHKTRLLAALTDTQSPFRELHRQQLEVVGEGSSAAEAARQAQQQLTEKVSQPLSEWLFD